MGVAGGPEGVALAQLATPTLLLLPNLFLCFAGSPVTVAGFFRAIRTPVAASYLMIAGLVVLRMIVPGHDSLVSLCLRRRVLVRCCMLRAACCCPGAGRKRKNLLADFAALLPATPLCGLEEGCPLTRLKQARLDGV